MTLPATPDSQPTGSQQRNAAREKIARAIFGVIMYRAPDAFHSSFEADQELWFAAADAAGVGRVATLHADKPAVASTEGGGNG